MNWIRSALFTLALLIAAAGAQAAGMRVAVSIPPQKYLVEKIGGGFLDVLVLVGRGEDPHTYESGPRQMETVSRLAAFFAIGVEFEQIWLPRFRQINPGMVVIQTGQGPEAQAHDHGHEPDMAREAENEHGHSHEGGDPHVWTSPPEALAVAQRILDGLIDLDPANVETYRRNFAALAAEIESLDAYIRGLFADVPENRRAFLVFHPAWGHFAKAYDLAQIAVQAEGREPSPAELARVIVQARDSGVTVLFVQPQVSAHQALAVAGEIGARLETLDPLAPDWEANLRRAAGKIHDSMTSGGAK